MSDYRADLEVHDVPPAAEAPFLSGSLFVRATTSIQIRTLEVGAELTPLLTLGGARGDVTLHFQGGPRAVERLRDRLTDYLLLLESAAADGSEDHPR